MLRLVIPGDEYFNEETSEFITQPEIVLDLEHSLFSLSKWESEFEKIFLNAKELTEEESLGYFQAMVVTPDISPEVFSRLTSEQVNAIHSYIGRKMTATTFGNDNRQGQKRIISSELLYCWMTMAGIPYECQHWHLNRLITLLRVYDAETNQKKPRRAGKDALAQRRAMNEQRKAQLKT